MTQLSDALTKAFKNRGSWSYRRIEREMQDAGHDVSFSTIGVYLRGEHGKPEERVLRAFAAVLPELSVVDLRRLADLPAGELGPWRPPAVADRLSQDQRDALDQLIQSIVTPAVAGAETDGVGVFPAATLPEHIERQLPPEAAAAAAQARRDLTERARRARPNG